MVPAIPENLKEYGPEILAGLAAADRRRHELANAWGYPARQPADGPVKFAELPRVAIYTDGACSGNPGPGGWAAVLRYAGKEAERSGRIASTTSNRAELQAVIEALQLVTIPHEIDIYTDSRYVLAGVASPIRRGKNTDLWAKITELAGPHKIKYHWVAGHAGNPENERANELAQQAIDSRPLEKPRLENTAVNPQLNSQPAALQPVKFWPLVGIAAARRNEGRAWRCWALAKSLDKPGLGAIRLDDLQALANELGIHPKTWRRCLADARRLKLIRERAAADGWVVLASQEAAAVLLGCDYAGPRPASITAGDLVGPGWRAYVWAAYEATHQGKPISRAKQESLTGVPVSTQRAYDNQAGVARRPNYAVSNYAVSGKGKDYLSGVAECEGRAAPFKFWDRQGRRWILAWRLPDCRTASAAESGQRGRSKKINRAIKRLTCKRDNGLSYSGQAESYNAGGVQALRIFHRTDKQAKATERKLARADYRPAGELYLFRREGNTADIWHVLPQRPAVAV